jgi:hypothetical protein
MRVLYRGGADPDNLPGIAACAANAACEAVLRMKLHASMNSEKCSILDSRL